MSIDNQPCTASGDLGLFAASQQQEDFVLNAFCLTIHNGRSV